MNFSFCLSGKLFISLLILNDNFAKQSILNCRLLSFSNLIIRCHSFLACNVSTEKSADDGLIGFALCVTSFPLAVFKMFYLSLTFAILIAIYFDMALWVHLAWNSLCFLDLNVCFLSDQEYFQPLFLQIAFCPILSLLLLGSL